MHIGIRTSGTCYAVALFRDKNGTAAHIRGRIQLDLHLALGRIDIEEISLCLLPYGPRHRGGGGGIHGNHALLLSSRDLYRMQISVRAVGNRNLDLGIRQQDLAGAGIRLIIQLDLHISLLGGQLEDFGGRPRHDRTLNSGRHLVGKHRQPVFRHQEHAESKGDHQTHF